MIASIEDGSSGTFIVIAGVVIVFVIIALIVAKLLLQKSLLVAHQENINVSEIDGRGLEKRNVEDCVQPT